MKKILLTVIVFIGLSVSVFAQSSGYQEETVQRLAPKKQRLLVCGSVENPIRVAGYMNYPPFGWKETRQMQGRGGLLEKEKTITDYFGIGAQLFDKFAKENKLFYIYVNMLNFDEAKYALTKGYFDVLLNNYFEGNSYSNMGYFYPAYIANPIIIVVRKTETAEPIPQTLEELKGKKGVVRAEENLFDMLYSQLPSDVSLEKVNGARRAFQALLRKEVDFLITSQLAYETEVRRFKIRDFLNASTTPIMSPFVFFSYAQGNPCANFIKNAFEKKLQEYTADKDYMRSVLSSQLIAWENKFVNEKSLMYDIDVIEEEKVEKAKDLDAWLTEQQNKADDKIKQQADKIKL